MSNPPKLMPNLILVTRPQPEADRLCVILQEHGIQAVASPLVTIEYPACPPIEYQNIQALIATSKNGLRALMRSQYKRFFFELPLFAVGKSTALLAKTLGFTKIYIGDGTAKDLLPLIAEHCQTDKGTLFHLAGSVVAFDLKTALTQQGYSVIAPVIYHARAEKALMPKIRTQMAMKQIKTIILMSPRMTHLFLDIMKQEHLDHLLESLDYYCLSPAVARPLEEQLPASQSHIHVAPKADQDSLIRLIRNSLK